MRTLLVNFPANPTGDVLSDDELAALAELARERDLVLVSDEVYNWIRYDDRPRTLLEFAPDRTIVIGAASKEYLIPGARTGYVLSADSTFSGESRSSHSPRPRPVCSPSFSRAHRCSSPSSVIWGTASTFASPSF